MLLIESIILLFRSPCVALRKDWRPLAVLFPPHAGSRIVVATFLSTSILVDYMLAVLISKFNGRRLASKKTFSKYNV